jgi:uncharacterized membrane protein (UPF0127 family)
MFAFVLLAIVLVGTAFSVGFLPRPLTAGVQEETPTTTPGAERATTVTIYAENGTVLGVVNASVADAPHERYTGLSPYESLANGSGKLFVYDEEDNHTFVMRKMDFPLDIVFIGADGRITVIHGAPVPSETEGDDLKRYPGRGKWVLEVPRGWMAAQGITEGNRVEIEYRDSPVNITTAPGAESSLDDL